MIVKAAAVLALITSIGGGIFAADARYVQNAEYQDFQWGVMKEQLRELRKEIAQNPSDYGLKEDYNDLLDMFCRKYSDDRECK